MAKKKKEKKRMHDEPTNDFRTRIGNRKGTWGYTTMKLINNLMEEDPEPDEAIKYTNAASVATNLALEIGFENIGFFWIGITSPLKDAIQATTLVNEDIKAKIIADLTPTQ